MFRRFLRFIFVCGMIWVAAPIWAATPLSITYTNKSGSPAVRAGTTPITYTFDIYDGSTLITSSLSGLWTVKVYDSADTDVTSSFTTSISYPGSSGTVSITPKFDAPIDTSAPGFYIGVQRADDGTYVLAEETTKNPGDLADGEFLVDYAALHIVYQGLTPTSVGQQNGVSAVYSFNIYYPDGASQLTSGSGSLLIKVWDGSTDVSSNFTIGSPVFNVTQWEVPISANYNATIKSGYTITVAKTTADTLNTAETYKANASTTADGSGNVGLGSPAGEFQVTQGQPTITTLSRDKAIINLNDGVGVNYVWESFFEDTSTRVSSTHVAPGEWVVKVYDSSNADQTANFTVGTPTYNAGTGQWTVNVQALGSATLASGYKIGIAAPTISWGGTIAEELSTVDLGSPGGEFEVQAANLHIVYAARSASNITKANSSSQSTFDFNIYYPSLTELTTDGGAIQVRVLNSGGTDVSSDFNISAVTYSAGAWHVTIDAKSAAVAAAGYYIGVSKIPGSVSDTLAEYASNASTTPDGNGNAGLGSPAGEVTVDPAALAIQYTSRSNAVIQRADGTGTLFQWEILYPDSSRETNDTGYSLVVRNSGGSDVTAQFNVSSISYNSGASRWEATVTALDSTTTASGYYIEVSKSAGGEGDTLAAYASNAGTSGLNQGLGGTNGVFQVTNAALHIVYANRSGASIVQAGTGSSTFTYNVYYPDGSTQENNDSGYTIVVRDSGGSDVTANFNVTAPAYGAGVWSVSVTAQKTTPVASGYYIEVSKSAGSEGDTLAAYASNASTTPDGSGNAGLGATNGVFAVTDAVLSVTFRSRNNAQIGQNDGVGVNYYYNLYYPNGTDEETVDGGTQTINVFDSGSANVNAQFTIGTPTYGAYAGCAPAANCWQVNIQSKVSTPLATGYYVGVSKSAGGTTGETFSEEVSTVDLGGVNGVFEVTSGRLYIVYNSVSANTITRAAATPLTWRWNVYLPGTSTEETDDAGYVVRVYNSSNVDISAQFTITGPTYTGGFWQATINPLDTATVAGANYITVSKPAGGDGQLVEATSHSNASTTPDGYGNAGLGSPNGEFAVTNASLSANFGSWSNASIERADGIGTRLTFNVYYPDGSTEENNDSGYTVKLYNSTNTLLETFAIGATPYSATGTNFDISGYQYSGGAWQFDILAHQNAPTGAGYYVTVEKAAGGEGDTLAAATSPTFTVSAATLSINYVTRTQARIERWNVSSSTEFQFRVLYDDGITQETSDSGYVLRVYNSGSALQDTFNLSGSSQTGTNFDVTALAYSGGVWRFSLTGKTGATAPDTYYVTIEKTAGGTGDTLAAYASNAGTSGNNIGLGAVNGIFEVTNLGLEMLSRDNAQIERADGTGVNFYYRLFVDNNTSGSEVTTEAASQTINVYNSGATQVTGQFTVGTPVYGAYAGCAPAANCWQVNVLATNTTTIGTGYYIDVAKNLGTSNLIAEDSKVDLGGVNGVFEVQPGQLNVTYLSNSNTSFPRQNGAGTDYTFRMYFGDGTTQKTTGAGDIQVRVFNSSAVDVTGSFTVTAPVYGGGVWTVRVEANTGTPAGTNYYIHIGESAVADPEYIQSGKEAISYWATDGSSSPAPYTHRGLGDSAGRFDVTDARLTVHFNGTSLNPGSGNNPANTFARNDGTGITYYYQLFFPDGATQMTAGDGYEVKVYDSSNANVTANFTVGAPSYNAVCPIATDTGLAGCWSVNVQSNAVTGDTSFWNDYRVGILKTAGTDGNYASASGAVPTAGSTDDIKSNIAQDGASPWNTDSGLGAISGVFDVTDQVISYISRSVAAIQRADNGVMFEFEMFTPTTAGTEVSDDPLTGSTIRVYNSGGTDVSAQFTTSVSRNIGTGRYELTVKALPTATVGTGFYVGLARNEGGSAAVALETFTNATGQLGASGVFDVNYADLTVKFISDSIAGNNQFERADGTGITYNYRVYYPDGVTEKTSGTGWTIEVLNNTGGTDANTTGNFTVSAPSYAAGQWSVNVTSNDAATIANDYKIRIYKPSGADDKIDLANAKLSTDATGSASDGGLGAGIGGGAFEVINATLNITYVSRTNAVIEQGDDLTVDYRFRAFYDDGTTQETNDSGYVLKIYDAGSTLLDTFTLSGSAQTGTNFNVSALAYTGGSWLVSLNSHWDSGVATGYYITVEKTAGTEGDTLAAYASNAGSSGANVGLGGVNGVFEVSNASLNIVYNNRSPASLQRGDSASITYQWKMYYDNMSDEETVDAGSYNVVIRDSSNVDVTANFTVSSGPSYNGGSGFWEVVFTTQTTTPVASGYYMEVSKTGGGTSGDTFAAYASNAGTTGLNQGLGSPNGEFSVTNAALTLTYVSRNVTSFERADGAGTTYRFTMQFPNGTYITDSSFGLPTPYVYQGTKTGTNRTTEFTIGSLTYAGSNEWTVNLQATDTTTVASTFTLAFDKTTGDTIALKDATEDLGTGTGAPQGEFAVTNATLNVHFNYRSVAFFNRADGVGVTYGFTVTYDDNTTQETNDTGYTVRILDSSGTPLESFSTFPSVGTNWQVGALSYNVGNSRWEINVQARDTLAPATGFYIDVSKTAGGEGDVIAVAENSKDGDTLDATTGVFEVKAENVLHIVYTGKSVSSFRRTDGVGITFNYRVFYADGTTQETDDYTGYIIRVYDSSDTLVETFQNVASGATPVAGSNGKFTLNTFAYNGGTTQWDVTLVGTATTTVASNYYISVQKLNVAPATEPDDLAEKVSTISTTADVNGNVGLGDPGGRFDVTNLRVAAFSQTNTTMEQLDNSADQVQYSFEMYNNEDTVTKLTSADLTAGNFAVTVYDSTDADVTSEFNVSALSETAGTWSFSLQAKQNSSVGSNYYVTIDYPVSGTNALTQYSTKTTNEFSVTDATLHIEYHSMSSNEFEKVDGVGSDIFFSYYYDDGTAVTDLTPGNSGVVLRMRDSGGSDVSANFTITAPAYGADASCAPAASCWKTNVQALISANAAAGYYFTVEKTASGNNDTLAEFGSNQSTTADANGNKGLDNPGTGGVNEGEIKINNATLYIVYQSISKNTQERGEPTGIDFTFNTYYKTGAEMTSEANEFVAKVYDSGAVDKTAFFSVGTPSYSGGVWTINIRATNNTPIASGYYIALSKNPGSLGAILSPEKNSNMSTTADPQGNIGLGSPNGEFSVTGAALRIAYQSRTNASVQRLENSASAMTVFQWKVYYRDNSEETNDTGYSVTVYDSGNTDVTANFDFYNWGTCSFDTGAFAEANHLKYTNDTCPGAYGTGAWKLGLRPKKNASIATGYYVVVSKAAGGEGDLLDPSFTGLTDTPYKSKSANETVGNGTWTGLGATNGVFEVTGANLTVKFVSDSITTGSNEFERADGVGITYSFTLHYPNGDAVDNSLTPDNFVAEVLDDSDTVTGAGEFTVGAVTWNAGSSQWDVNVQANPSAANLAGPNYYRLRIYKNAGTDGDLILLANAKKSSDATGTATDGGLGTGLGTGPGWAPTGEFNVLVGSTSITYLGRTNDTVEQADDISPTYTFRVYFDDGTTEETSASGYVLRVYDSADTLQDTFTLSGSAQTGTNFGVSALTYGTEYSVSVTPLKASPVGTDFYISIEKTAGSSGDTLAEYASNATTTGNNVGLGTSNGVFAITEATLNIVYNSRSVASVERGDSTPVLYRYKMLYDNGVDEETIDAANYAVTVRDSLNADVTANFSVTGPAYNGGSGFWEYTISALKSTPVGTGYYIDVVKTTAGTSGDTFASAYASNAGTSGANVGLGSPGGEFDVTQANLRIDYVARSNASVQRMEPTLASAVEFTYNVYYKDNTEETSDTGYTVTVYDSSNADVTANFDFYDYTGSAFAAGAFDESKNLSYAGGVWKVAVRPKKNATIASGYYIVVSKSAGSTGDTLDPSYAPLTDKPFKSKSADETVTNGIWSGVGASPATDGVFAVNGAALTVKYVSDSISGNNQFERADGTGITYNFTLHYPDGSAKSDTDGGAVDNIVAEVLDAADAVDSSGSFTVSTPTYNSGSSQWSVTVTADDTANTSVNFYKIRIYKNAGTDGDYILVGNAKLSNAATGSATDGGLGAGIAGGEFEVTPANLHIVYQVPASHPTVNRGATPGNGITFGWQTFYGDNTTQETTDSDSYILKVYDKSDTLVETFDFSASGGWTFPYTGTNNKFKVSADLAYNGGNSRWEVEVLAASGQTEDTDFYITVEKAAGTKVDTLAAYQSKASTTPDANGNVGLNAGANEGAFDVAGQILHVIYSAPTSLTLNRADTAMTLPFVIEYPDTSKYDLSKVPTSSNTEGFTIKVYRDLGTVGTIDGSDIVVDTFTSFSSLPANGTEFALTAFDFNTGTSQWELSVKALKTANASAGNNSYYISVEKANTGTQGSADYQPDQLPAYETARSTTPDANGNVGLDAGADEGNWTVNHSTLTIQYVSRSSAKIAHGDQNSTTTYAMSIAYPDGTAFTDADAGGSDNSGQTNTVQVTIRDGSATDRTAEFEANDTGSSQTSAVYNSSTGNWEYKIFAPFIKTPETGFYIETQVTSSGGAGTDDEAVALASTDTGANGLGANGGFDVGEATLSVKFMGITRKLIEPQQNTTVRFQLLFSQSQIFDSATALSDLNKTKITIHKAEDGSEHSGDFKVLSATYEGNATWAFQIQATGSDFSKVGEYVQISGTTDAGDLVSSANTKTLASESGNEDDGIFVVASETVLYQNFPNPFNPTSGKTTIRFNLLGDNANADFTLKIFTVSGRLVKSFSKADVVNNQKVYWDGKNDQNEVVASGIYYCVMEVGGYRKVIKIAVVK